MLKGLLAIAGLLTLTACNMVVTDKPMFSAADGAGAPPLRAGVWRIDDPACAFDERQAQNQWPECAHASPPLGETAPWLLVAGAPPLLQMPLPLPKGTSVSVDYFYMAYRPLKVDEKGRVVEMATWFVQCGAPPPPAPGPVKLEPGAKDLSALGKAALTKAPFPGLTLRTDMADCTAATPVALRNAARASEGLEHPLRISHWVRDAGPGDKPAITADAFNALMQASPGP